MNTNGDGDVLGESYLLERGVLLETFTSHGGEIDYLLGRGQFCQRLKRGYGNGRCDPAWNELESILWFRVPSFNGELAHYIARALRLTNDAAKAFLESMPMPEALLPVLDIAVLATKLLRPSSRNRYQLGEE